MSDDEIENETKTSSWWMIWLSMIVVAMIVLVFVTIKLLNQPTLKKEKRVTWSDGWTGNAE